MGINDFLNKIEGKRDILKKYPFVGSFFIFLAAFCIYSLIYISSPGISFVDDHFFHFKLAYLFRTEGLSVINNFDWIYYTNQAQNHERYSFSLFQFALIPFTYFKNLILGLKISDIFWGSLNISLIYWVFKKLSLNRALFFTFVLFSCFVFFDRMLIGRALVLVSGLTLLEIYLAHKRKYLWLFVVSAFHILWHYNTFFLPMAIVLMTEAARYLIYKKIFLKNLYFSILGIVFGAAFLPKFPLNIFLYFENILSVQGGIVQGDIRGEGTELYPVDLFKIAETSEIFLLFFLLLVGVVFWLYIKNKKSGEKSDEKGEFLSLSYIGFFLSLMSFSGSIMLSGRYFGDFFFPAITFFSAAVLTYLISKEYIKIRVGSVFIMTGLVIFFVIKLFNSAVTTKKIIFQNDYRPLSRVSEWVKSESKPGEIIYLFDWSDFPVAFFYNHKNVYAMGIEPRALLEYDQRLFWKWYNFYNNGFYCDFRKDCLEEKNAIITKTKDLPREQKDEIRKENFRKILLSIKNDFKADFLISRGDFIDEISLNDDLIEDSFEAKSELSNVSFKAFKLK